MGYLRSVPALLRHFRFYTKQTTVYSSLRVRLSHYYLNKSITSAYSVVERRQLSIWHSFQQVDSRSFTVSSFASVRFFSQKSVSSGKESCVQSGTEESDSQSFLHLPYGTLEETEEAQVSENFLQVLLSIWDNYVAACGNMLLSAHEYFHIPWFALIGVATIMVRLALLPVTLISMRSIAIMKCLKPQLDEIHKKTAVATSRLNDQLFLQAKKEYLDLLRKYKADPLKNFYAPLIQTPVILSFYWGVRGLGKRDTISLAQGGIAWFQDLSVPDPHHILPALCSTIYLLTLRIGRDTLAVASNPKALLSARIMTIIGFPLTLKLPALVFCYLLPNNCFTFLLNWMLQYSWVRERLGFPSLQGELPKKDEKNASTTQSLDMAHSSRAEREAMAALSYLRSSRYSPLFFAAKRGVKPKLSSKPKKKEAFYRRLK
eukprot:jgi/Galph1/1134/GphlegSOOS_G5788.1